jgi:AcrR family transcriptional regulator
MAARGQASASTGAREPLSRERVLGAAVALADAGGIAGLSMRKLADALGVEAMSLYHHFANKDQILDGMVDVVFGEIEFPVRRVGWQTAMRRRGFAAREALTRHAWALGLLESRRNPGLATLRHHELVLGCLRRGGFSVEGAAHAFSALDSYTYGFVMQEQALPFRTPEEIQAMAASITTQLPADEFPYFMEMVVEHVLRPGYAYAKEFEIGLELVIDGLERMRAAGEPRAKGGK